MRTIERYGWQPDLPDHRDLELVVEPDQIANLPAVVDLRPKCPPVYDQGQLGSCTANAIGAAIQFEQMKQAEAAFTPSRLWIYYNERAMEGSVGSDSGAQIRDGMKAVAKVGYPPERGWPYDISTFTGPPPARAAADAPSHKVSSYQRVTQDLDHMKACLAAGYGFVFGFSVYESFESEEVASTGHVPMPARGEAQIGGHAVWAAGYDDKIGNGMAIVRNSWGPKWGLKGYFLMPYEYLTNRKLASDFWTVRLAT